MKYITLANWDVCEYAWYINHGISKSTYNVYNSATKRRSISRSHRFARIFYPHPHTIQAKANMMTITTTLYTKCPMRLKKVARCTWTT